MLPAIRLISEAADLAARRHNGMARKGRGNEPYINHLAEVANLLAIATDGADAELVAAGWLHDTMEDTDTTREELSARFSDRVALLVIECTDDMSLPKAERRRLQVVDAPKKSADAKLIKIADKISNIGALIHSDPTTEERDALAPFYLRLLRGVDALYDTPTPYISAWHQAPVAVGRENVRLHLEITSPRRAADKLKYLAGSEAAMGAWIGDVTPESAAERLRAAIDSVGEIA